MLTERVVEGACPLPDVCPCTGRADCRAGYDRDDDRSCCGDPACDGSCDVPGDLWGDPWPGGTVIGYADMGLL